MKKALCLFIVSITLLFSDVIYYYSDYKMVNCDIITSNDNLYIVNTVTKNGISSQEISKRMVKAIEETPFDTLVLTQMVAKTKEDKQKKAIAFNETKKVTKTIVDDKQTNKQNKPNKNKTFKLQADISSLCLGAALTTHGIFTLADIPKINAELEQYPEDNEMFEEIIAELKRNRNRALLYGGIFTVAGTIDIVFSFKKIDISTSGNSIELSYNF